MDSRAKELRPAFVSWENFLAKRRHWLWQRNIRIRPIGIAAIRIWRRLIWIRQHTLKIREHNCYDRMKQKMTRREMLKGIARIGTIAALPGCSTDRMTKQQANINRIRRENTQPGTRDWMLTTTRVEESSRYRSQDIEGFCSRASVRAGENIDIFISTNSRSEVSLEIYRMGYYGGGGGGGVS